MSVFALWWRGVKDRASEVPMYLGIVAAKLWRGIVARVTGRDPGPGGNDV